MPRANVETLQEQEAAGSLVRFTRESEAVQSSQECGVTTAVPNNNSEKKKGACP